MTLVETIIVRSRSFLLKRPTAVIIACLLILSGLKATPALCLRYIGTHRILELSGGLTSPSDVAVSKKGVIYVVDGVNHLVRRYDSSGKPLSSFGGKGSGKGDLRSPLGIGLADRGTVYVADSGNQRVQVFTPEGRILDIIDVPPKKGHPADPTDVAVDDTRQRLYIVDNDNHCIRVFNLSLKKWAPTIGTPGTGKGNFRYPFMLTVDREGYLYVVDVINTRVQVLNPDGKFVAFIGGWGVEKGEFFRPKGTATDSNGRVYVSDSYLGVIQVFNPLGELYALLGEGKIQRAKKFNTPVGIFVDRDSRLYVVEMLANRVSVYDMRENAEY